LLFLKSFPSWRTLSVFAVIVAAVCPARPASAQTAEPNPSSPLYARRNSFGIFTAYSNDSSHVLLGQAEQRKLFDIGLSYSRRLFADRVVNWQYDGEILPIALESDPLTAFINQQTSPTTATYRGQLPFAMLKCAPIAQTYFNVENGVTYAGTQTEYCSGRQWTVGEAMSPIGMQWNFLPRRYLQPILAGHAGYMYSTRPIPVAGAGSFNFTFDFRGGFELFRSSTHSFRVEYSYHHISNKDSAIENPGIDNGVFHVSWVFGR
jgi:hypothetical protein